MAYGQDHGHGHHAAPAAPVAAPTRRRTSNVALLAGAGGLVCLLVGLGVLVGVAICLGAVGAGAAVAASDDSNVFALFVAFFLAVGGLMIGRGIVETIVATAPVAGVFVAVTLALAAWAHVGLFRDRTKKGLGWVLLAYVSGLLAVVGLVAAFHAEGLIQELDRALDAPPPSASAAAVDAAPPATTPPPTSPAPSPPPATSR